VDVYQALFGETPKTATMHAGLECAVIGERFEGMDMISFGPDIEAPHSPQERMRLSSVGRTWQFLVALVQALADERQ
jgi:dipeptidase D